MELQINAKSSRFLSRYRYRDRDRYRDIEIDIQICHFLRVPFYFGIIASPSPEPLAPSTLLIMVLNYYNFKSSS